MQIKTFVAVIAVLGTVSLLTPQRAICQAAMLAPAREIRLWEILPDGGGQPVSLAIDRLGRVVIAQRNPAGVHVLDSASRLLRSIGRQGRGPGEFAFPRAVLHGDSVVVWDGQLRRLSVFAIATGRLVRDVSVRASGTLLGISSAGQVYLRNTMSKLELDESGISVVRVTLRGEIIDTLEHRLLDETASRATSVWRVSMTGGGGYATAIPFVPRPVVAMHPDGRLLLSWPPSGSIQQLVAPSAVQLFHRSDLAPQRIPIERRRAARDSALAADAPPAGRAALAPMYRLEDIPAQYSPWSRIDVDGMGRLVLTDPSANDRVHRVVVLSGDGPTRTVHEMAADKVGTLQAWGGAWFASLVDADEGTLLTIFRVR